jgi:Tfp pilus assembly protein PilO
MVKTHITKKIFGKKAQDYTFAILFFLIFSLFILFAIRPSLTTATGLKKEEFDLKKIDSEYESKIINIASVQSLMEEHREELPLLTDAISSHPQVNKLIDDIKRASDKTAFSLKRASIGEVNLLDTKQQKLQTLHLTIEGSSSFDTLIQFIQTLFHQRRLKIIQKMIISKDQQEQVSSTGSAQLKVLMDIEAYYL